MAKFIRTASVGIRILNYDSDGAASGYSDDPIRVAGLRVSFQVQKNLAWSTNTAKIQIWNLSDTARNRLNNFGDEVTLYAGYARGAGQELVYVGNTTSVSHAFNFPDIITTLECGDGERYANQKHDSLSFKAGTSARYIIEYIAKSMGVSISEFSSSPDLFYSQGFQFAGMTKEAIQKVCSYLNLQASFQNNTLQIIPVNGTVEQPPFQINSNTGMIGIPQRYSYKRQGFYQRGPAVGWKVAMLLEPSVLPGRRLEITSRNQSFNGIFRAETVRHNGDTYGSNWQTDLEVTQVYP